jgi:hypothetical protein
VGELARAKDISVVAAITLEAPTFDGGSITYRIDLSGAGLPATVHLDHQAFTAGNEFFAAVVVPKLAAAIDKLRETGCN